MSQTPPMGDSARSNGRDRTPELASRRERRPRGDHDEDDHDRSARHRQHREHREQRERERDREGEDPDRERRKRRPREDETEEERRERKRRQYDEETEEERAERHRRRRDREREYEDREPRRHEREPERRERDRSKESHRSHRSHRSGRDPRDARDARDPRDPRDSRDHRDHRDPEVLARREMSREEREAERERRDQEMREERRQAARMRDDRHDDRRMQDRPQNSPRRRSPPPPPMDRPRQPSPPREEAPPKDAVTQFLENVDSESRSIFVSQLASRMSSRDVGLFFEDKLGPRSVKEARVVTDRVSRRSKGIAYVELASADLINEALSLSGQLVMGIPIQIQVTEAEKNHETQMASIMSGGIHAQGVPRPPPPPKVHFPPLSTGLRLPSGFDVDSHRDASIPYHRLYVTNVAFTLSSDDVRQVFEAFGEIEFVDLHTTFSGESKGSAYVQFKELGSAQMALDAMNNFEIAGRHIKVQVVQERSLISEQIEDDHRGPRMDATARQQLMFKLARTEGKDGSSSPATRAPPSSRAPPMDPTKYLVVSNMFNPEEETDRNWDLDLAEDVKGEVEGKYGTVKRIKVDGMSAGDVYIEFETVRSADAAHKGLGGRFFGGRRLEAKFTSETLFKAHM